MECVTNYTYSYSQQHCVAILPRNRVYLEKRHFDKGNGKRTYSAHRNLHWDIFSAQDIGFSTKSYVKINNNLSHKNM